MANQKSSAWPLALAYAALIVYASLYPFGEWRDQGISPWAFLQSPWPRYWTGFDVGANVAGYAPLGFLLALAALRAAAVPSRLHATGFAFACAALLSLAMEALQSYLPARVPSNVDFALNAAGGLAGGVAAVALERVGALTRWSRVRSRWFVADARGALVLLALWPFALLVPTALPFGLGQVFERAEEALAQWLQDTPFLEWLPMRELELQPMVPAAELVCVALGLLIPCLLGYTVLTSAWRRLLFAGSAVAVGVGITALSASLSWGPVHAWAWVSPSVRAGLLAGWVLALLLVGLSRRASAAVLLLALVVHLSLLNQAPEGAYFAATLSGWEQGRFVRFHGVAQWLGWLWPYVALLYVLVRLSVSDGARKGGGTDGHSVPRGG